MVMIFLMVSVSSLVFLSLCCHSQFQPFATIRDLSIHLHSHCQIFFSQAFHKSKSLSSFFIFYIQTDESDSLFMEESLEFIAISIWLNFSNVKFIIVVHCFIILLLTVLRKLVFLNLFVCQLWKCWNSDNFIIRMKFMLENVHFFQEYFRKFESKTSWSDSLHCFGNNFRNANVPTIKSYFFLQEFD